jgi:hypothetical protein
MPSRWETSSFEHPAAISTITSRCRLVIDGVLSTALIMPPGYGGPREATIHQGV